MGSANVLSTLLLQEYSSLIDLFVVYELFPPAFRTAFGVPVDYRSIFAGADGASPVSLAAAGNEVEEPLLAIAVDVSDDIDRMQCLEFDSVTGPEHRAASAEEATVLRLCTSCDNYFEKSKSHQGTRCWSCKKKTNRATSSTISVPEQ